MPIMGYNFGARKKQRLNSATKYGCVIALVLMGAGMLVFWLMPDVLLSIFNASADMLKIGVPGLRIISLCFLPAAWELWVPLSSRRWVRESTACWFPCSVS